MKKNISCFEKEVYAVCRKIPEGKLSTYKAIAKAVDSPLAVRAVGNALRKNPYAPEVPCHRVIRSDGRIGGFARGQKKKEALLRKEGIQIVGGMVDDLRGVLMDTFPLE